MVKFSVTRECVWRCKTCGKEVIVKENLFTSLMTEIIGRFLMLMHCVIKHKDYNALKKVILSAPIIIIGLIIGVVIGLLKIISLPFWWFFENF